ncbi:carboxypeptidase-like regulatory domain-containing protein [Chitinophaga sedimenti]|uniref:STN domain-containing protein n=1 Tax=Chitinophaga sedimenti TaxID=2033606 RepID=UPI002005EF14|nr:STN domain-containing protein [Chitinophaga sedimenti]MCK7553676.1 carboxypeptidase-like regulatory domain-containing protein [Chitinophaga sedimenti]
MKLTTLLLLTALLQTKANAYSQQITLRVKNTPLDKVCAQISRQSGYHFFFNERLVKDARKVSLDLQGVSLQQALDACFSGQPFNYIIVDNTVVVRKKSDPPPLMHLAASPLVLVVKGRVTNEKGEPLPGASVKLKNSTKGATSDAKGEFNFTVPDGTTVELEITMLGFKTQAMTPSDPANVVIVLKEEATTLDNLVVIGYGTTRRQDFTGSVASVKMEGSPIASLPNMNIWKR